jgi:hypothetical protein
MGLARWAGRTMMDDRRMDESRAGRGESEAAWANPIYLPEGGKARHLPVFEICAAHRSRTISFFLGG